MPSKEAQSMEINYLKRGGKRNIYDVSEHPVERFELIMLRRDFSSPRKSFGERETRGSLLLGLPRFSEFLDARGSATPLALPASGSVGNFYAGAACARRVRRAMILRNLKSQSSENGDGYAGDKGRSWLEGRNSYCADRVNAEKSR